MRRLRSKSFSRRQVLTGIGAASAGALIPTHGFGQEDFWTNFARNRALRNTNREANTNAAFDAIDTSEPILSFDTAYNLQLAIMQFERIADAGGWQEMSARQNGLIVGNERRGVRELRQRLILGGDLSEEHDSRSDIFDQHMDSAVRRFQVRHGLQVSGKVEPATIYAMNVPVEYRLAQLRLNMQRVEALAPKLSDNYVVVNIPAAVIEAIEGGMVERRHTAVVGRIDRQTPILHSRIHQINFNPYWNVPKSLIRRDLIKYMNEDPEYLTKYRIRILDGRGNELLPTDIDWSTEEAVNYRFRQDPGAENSMGHVKINFHNRHAVYLHDTPTKSLFGENQRFHSSGCVRVEDVDAMVAWLLKNDGDWNTETVKATFNSGERLDVSIRNPVPIHTTYISAWANRDGVVSFRDDVYEYDKVGKVIFES